MKEILVTTLDFARIKKRISDEASKTGFLSKDLQKLSEELNRAKVIEPKKIPKDVLTMNSQVRLKYLTNGRSLEVKVVYPEEADIKTQKVSIFAPIATALLGYRKGDVIDWPIHNNTLKVKIDDIIYQPEAAGNFDL